MNRIRIALADDHPVVLEGVKALLRTAPDFELVAEATSGAAALKSIRESRPHIAVIDISMPDINGIELARRLAEACPEVKLIALTVHESRAYLQPLLDAGARGYLLKRSAADQLAQAIRAVMDGGIYLDPAIAEKALSRAPNGESEGVETDDLSPREEEVLRLLAHGLSNKEVAAEVGVSIKTIETYKSRATEKLGLRTRADIVRFGARRGWLKLSDD